MGNGKAGYEHLDTTKGYVHCDAILFIVMTYNIILKKPIGQLSDVVCLKRKNITHDIKVFNIKTKFVHGKSIHIQIQNI